MIKFAAVWVFPIARSKIVSILFVLVVTLSSPFSPSGFPEGIRRLPPYAHNVPNLEPAYRTSATVAVAAKRENMRRPGRVSGGSYSITDGNLPSVFTEYPPTFIEPGDGAIDPVEGGGSRKFMGANCDLIKTSLY